VDDRLARARDFVRRHGAADQPHPGGTLLGHLERTSLALRRWGAPESVALAGLVHAAYGTDWFGPSLVGWDDRQEVIDAVGDEAERLVWLYCAYERDFGFPQLGATDTPTWQHRLTGEVAPMPADLLPPFVELTFANELDVLSHNPDYKDESGVSLELTFRRCRSLVSNAAWEALEAVFIPA
jgi:hypothetical protein